MHLRWLSIGNKRINSHLIMETTNVPAALSCSALLLISTARRHLRCIINHPAFAPERRRKGETLISASTDATRLGQWQALALQECEAWEDARLRAEAAQPGAPASADYAY